MLGRGMNTTSSSLTSVKDREPIKGYRFQPTNEELINYLRKKILGYENQVSTIAEVDICKHEPWDLPALSKRPYDNTWYFFGRPDYKFRNSKRANRKTKEGYWKKTGKDRIIKNRGNNKTIGIKKNLVFYRGCVRNGVKTNWVIHEYHGNFSSSNGSDFVVCHLKQKSKNKINNSTIDKGESSHATTSGVENPVTEITFTELDWQYLKEILSSEKEVFNPPDAQQPEMCMEQGPSIGNLQNINNITNNYNVPLPRFGTGDLQDNTTTKWMNSSTANQDVYSIDGSMPILPYVSSPSESFVTLLVDDVEDTEKMDLQYLQEILSSEKEDFNPPDAHQPEMCMEQDPSIGNLQNINNITNNYNVPLPQFGTGDLQDNNITKWMNSSTANQDVYSIDGSMPTLPYVSSPSESFVTLLVDDVEDTEKMHLQYLQGILSSEKEDFNPPDAHKPEMCMEQVPSIGNLQNINNNTDNYNVPLSQFGTSDLQDNTTTNQDVYSIDGSMPTLPYDSSPSESFGNLLVDDIGDTEEVDKWINSYFESAFGDYSHSNT